VRRPGIVVVASAVAVVAVTVGGWLTLRPTPGGGQDPTVRPPVDRSVGFIENGGQAPAWIRFHLPGDGARAALGDDGIASVVLTPPGGPPAAVGLVPVDADATEALGWEPTETTVSFLRGGPPDRHAGPPPSVRCGTRGCGQGWTSRTPPVTDG
jgi:hypothetical protein